MIAFRRFLLILALGFCALSVVPDVAAQVRVDLSLKRGLFIRYEPVVAIVTVTNLTGNPLDLADEGNHKWFSFHIEGSDGELIPPYNPDYTLSPVVIQPGESIKRAVNITPLYPITEYGIYRIRATVFESKSGNYFSSAPPLNVEITEGRTLWQQSVGVPDSDSTRVVTLLSHRLPDNTQLYLRIEDKASGLVYCTSQLGRYVSYGKPDIVIGANNDINILQNVAPKAFLYTHTNLDGKILERKNYASTDTSRPTLARDPTGQVQVIGGLFFDPDAVAAQQQKTGPPPSMSQRPVPLSKPD